MRILAFDQATLKTGYALFDGEDMVEHGVLERGKKEFKDTEPEPQSITNSRNSVLTKIMTSFKCFCLDLNFFSVKIMITRTSTEILYSRPELKAHRQ